MATFTATTYEQPIGDRRSSRRKFSATNRLGDHGVAFPVGFVVWIRDSDKEVIETTTITDPTDIDAAQTGSGDFGKSIFRNGRTYEVNATEETQLTNAGFTVDP